MEKIYVLIVCISCFIAILFWGLISLVEVKKENSSIFEKNSHWFFFNSYAYNKKMDIIINTFLKKAIKIKKRDNYSLVIYIKDRVLFIWIENKYYGYASHIRIAKSDESYLDPDLEIENFRPSYHTMCELISIEKKLDTNFCLVKESI